MRGILGPAEQNWVDRRWRVVAAAVRSTDAKWAEWAVCELAGSTLGHRLVDRWGWDVPLEDEASSGWDRVRDPAVRETLGQVFTPGSLAATLAEVAEVDRRPGSVLDPACGAGSLLVAVAEARHRAGWPVDACLEGLVGWDVDPVAVWLCRASLVEWALARHAPDQAPPAALRIAVVDGLDESSARFDAVVSNPPYLEAKRMGRAAPGLRERLRERFPELRGAFDLYLAFALRILELLDDGGRAALLVPNKITQGRYAAGFRHRLVEDPGWSVTHLVDLARMRPRPFPGTSVYPVVLGIRRGPDGEGMRGRRVVAAEDLHRPWERVAREDLAGVGGEHPLFVPFAETWPNLAPLFAGQRFGEIAQVSSTCSFHARGLREQYISEIPPASHGHPYLGGRSRTRRTEVGSFRIEWEGFWIRFDQDALRAGGNPLPDLQRTFLRPKAILCQHATRVRVAADLAGRFVTKDVYPVVLPLPGGPSVERLVAILSSTVFTALYNTVYQGILVGGETYHYLPVFLRTIPVPDPQHPALSDVDADVRALSEAPDAERWKRLDQAVAEAYGVSEAARERMVAVHLSRVGAERPAG